MIGERLAWYRVASHLHSTVEELAQRISYSEFLGWLDYLLWDEQRQTKLDIYLANIAAEVRRSYVKHPKTVKAQDFLIKVSEPKPAATGMASKAIWLQALNVKPKR